MTADTDEIQKALSHLFLAGNVVELRALGDGGVHSGYFTDFAALAERATALDTFKEIHGVYVTLNEVNPALLSRRANRVKQRLSKTDSTTADADIIRRRWLPIDLDPVRPSGVSSNDEEHTAALDKANEIAVWLAERGFPAPIIADSGNGAHLLYRIDLSNDGESLRLIKDCLTVLDAVFSDDIVHCDTANFNAARIWKCYGTTACKGDNTPERPHRTARILSAPDKSEIVPEAVLRKLADGIPRSAPAADQGRRRGSFDLKRWLDTHNIVTRTERPWQGGTLYALAECPFSTAHTDGAFAIQFINGAIFAGCHHNSCGGGTQRWGELRAMYEPERALMREKSETKPPEQNPCPRSDKPSKGSPTPLFLSDASPDQEEDHKKAMEILEHGSPLAFLLDVFHRDHVGDGAVAECLIMSVASQSVENTAGLHVALSGNSGKGKTHACNAMVRLLPEDYRLKGTVSDKALFYHESLKPGTVLLFDDFSLSDDMQELLKSATANFREPIEHRTLTRERQLRLCTIPERCVWWLAKVESIGDDQVMNRMLTVWIDDSKKQDQAVLDHLKKSEAGVLFSPTEDMDVLICRAMWEILKSAVRQVKIPFAERICFSAIQNRRNPAMLFDLMKCHALLYFLQRKTDEDGAIIATQEDFAYARTLFCAINGEGGGQETKLTKNEAAALASIAKMNLEVFTIQTLQDTLGLSYYQAYRLLHGYSVNKIRYQGILDKCPAISLIDATVAEAFCGIEGRQRKHYFSFDLMHYRRWSAQADVWLDEKENNDPNDTGNDDGDGADTGGDVCNFATALRTKKAHIAKLNNGEITRNITNKDTKIDRCTEINSTLRTLQGSYSNPDMAPCEGGCVCDPCNIAKLPQDSVIKSLIDDSDSNMLIQLCKPDCKAMQSYANMQTTTGTGGTPPLPGILDHRDFERSPVSLGHCTLCGNGAAVYQSKGQRCINPKGSGVSIQRAAGECL